MCQAEPKWKKNCLLISSILIYLDAASPTGQMCLSFQIFVFWNKNEIQKWPLKKPGKLEYHSLLSKLSVKNYPGWYCQYYILRGHNLSLYFEFQEGLRIVGIQKTSNPVLITESLRKCNQILIPQILQYIAHCSSPLLSCRKKKGKGILYKERIKHLHFIGLSSHRC